MGEEGTFYKGVFLMVFAFGVGFGVGYKVEELQHSPKSEISRLQFSAEICNPLLLIRLKNGGWNG